MGKKGPINLLLLLIMLVAIGSCGLHWGDPREELAKAYWSADSMKIVFDDSTYISSIDIALKDSKSNNERDLQFEIETSLKEINLLPVFNKRGLSFYKLIDTFNVIGIHICCGSLGCPYSLEVGIDTLKTGKKQFQVILE